MLGLQIGIQIGMRCCGISVAKLPMHSRFKEKVTLDSMFMVNSEWMPGN